MSLCAYRKRSERGVWPTDGVLIAGTEPPSRNTARCRGDADHLRQASAPGITPPVLHHVQGCDEVFPRDGQLQLFDLFASPEKIMRGAKIRW